ncbi:MAG: TonB-dependent receptor plug domain-containing protein [Bacteroides sp.]|nr:TonB-dependent receptor plug domain-containing protein [Bacteroides sp.]
MKSINHYSRPVGLFILLCLIPVWAFAQNVSVSGNVKDTSGEAVIGASVLELGTTNGTITDIDGNFTLSVAPDARLSISFIGYVSQEVSVAGKSRIDVTLRDDTKLLDEVVVVGYGQMKRSDLTGSVVSVSSDAIQKSVTTSIDQVLQGRAAGVQVQQNTGLPGGSSSIRIRGVSSLNASNEPIFVIDGVIIDGSTGSGSENALSSINPSDILSMDILKDASATAIYGARAANGVILITTKRGSKGEANVTYDGYIGWQQMPKKTGYDGSPPVCYS